jgi:hypothetical protein
MGKIVKSSFIKQKKRALPTVTAITGLMAEMTVGSTSADATGMADDDQVEEDSADKQADDKQADDQQADDKTQQTPIHKWKWSDQDECYHYYEWYHGSWWRRKIDISWTRMTEYF